jgi:PAS domain-containing protein
MTEPQIPTAEQGPRVAGAMGARPFRNQGDGQNLDYAMQYVARIRQSRPSILGAPMEHPRFYESLIEHSGQIAIVLGLDSNAPISFGGGSTVLKDCLNSPHATDIACALDALLKSGTAFEKRLRTRDGRSIKARGVPVGRRVVVYFQVENPVARAELDQARETLCEVIQTITLGIAILDSRQRLVLYNNSYAALWGLPKSWLDTRPSLSAIYDRLRDAGKLPQQRDFMGWKQKQLEHTFGAAQDAGAIWHLPGNMTLRIQTHPVSPGGRLLVFEDISENLTLETSLNLLLQVQKATIDALDDGAAIFGPHGRLLMHNEIFAGLWNLPESKLSAGPHLAEIAALCAPRYGSDDVWGEISDCVNSSEPDRQQRWKSIRRSDGRIFSLSMTRLPNGATIALFTDLTDLERFEAVQSEAKDQQRTGSRQAQPG